MGRFFALGLLSLGLVATAFGDHWQRTHAGPFEVISAGPEKDMREKMVELEQFRYALGNVLAKEDLQLVWPLRIIVQKRGAAAQAEPLPGRDALMYSAPENRPLPPELMGSLTKRFLDEGISLIPPDIEAGLIAVFSTIEVNGTHITFPATPPGGKADRNWARVFLMITDPVYAGRARVFFSNLQHGSDIDTASRNAFEKKAAEIDAQADALSKSAQVNAGTVSGKALAPRDFRILDMEDTASRLANADLLLATHSPAAKAAYMALHGPEAEEGLGLFALAAGDQATAKEKLALAVSLGSKSARAYYELAKLEKDAAKAIPLLKKAAELDPRWVDPLDREAAISTDPGRKAALLKKACELDRRDPARWQLLAETMQQLNQYTEAAKAWAGAQSAARTPEERGRILRAQARVGEEQAEYEETERRKREKAEADELERLRNQSEKSIQAAEAAANKRLNPSGKMPDKVVDWWDAEHGSQQVTGMLEQVQCTGKQARLVIRSEGKLIRLLVEDAAAFEKPLTCGAQNPPRKIVVGYNPLKGSKQGMAGKAVSVEFP